MGPPVGHARALSPRQTGQLRHVRQARAAAEPRLLLRVPGPAGPRALVALPARVPRDAGVLRGGRGARGRPARVDAVRVPRPQHGRHDGQPARGPVPGARDRLGDGRLRGPGARAPGRHGAVHAAAVRRPADRGGQGGRGVRARVHVRPGAAPDTDQTAVQAHAARGRGADRPVAARAARRPAGGRPLRVHHGPAAEGRLQSGVHARAADGRRAGRPVSGAVLARGRQRRAEEARPQADAENVQEQSERARGQSGRQPRRAPQPPRTHSASHRHVSDLGGTKQNLKKKKKNRLSIIRPTIRVCKLLVLRWGLCQSGFRGKIRLVYTVIMILYNIIQRHKKIIVRDFLYDSCCPFHDLWCWWSFCTRTYIIIIFL